MTKIKICGIKRLEDIDVVNTIHPDYIGFVFASFSHRFVDKEKARLLKDKLNSEIKAVGVFVDEDVERVAELINEGIIDIAQLHGSEDNEYIKKLRDKILIKSADISIIKTFNTDKEKDYSIINDSVADIVLIDSGMGSGETFDWSKLKGIERSFFLAGGLTPDNVKNAIDIVRPYGVDVSSGVESNGIKDPMKIKRFIEMVRDCYLS
jgi:phosphoribosylanthranilate isomerase